MVELCRTETGECCNWTSLCQVISNGRTLTLDLEETVGRGNCHYYDLLLLVNIPGVAWVKRGRWSLVCHLWECEERMHTYLIAKQNGQQLQRT